MASEKFVQLPEILKKYQADILKDWVPEQERLVAGRMKNSEVVEQCREFLRVFTSTLQSTPDSGDIRAAVWEPLRSVLSGISRSRGIGGFTPSETASFVLSLKQPVFLKLRHEMEAIPTKLVDELWNTTVLLDQFALFTTEVYQKSREELIIRQQSEMLELSTPVVKLWDGVLALPLIGTLDSSRTQVVMEALLQRIVETNSETAIIDITGVPTVDTLVAQHLIKTVTAARLMGAECIISGIRPQIAATIVHLGVDLGGITTKSTLADAFAIALTRTGKKVVTIKR